MRIQKILCPTDLSLNSANGIVYAYSLAHEYRAELVVMHVTTFPAVPLAAFCQLDALPSERRVYLPPTVDQILCRAKARLDAFVKSHVIGSGQTCVVFGKPAAEIIISAVQQRADLIVMAKRHMGRIRRLISPSISEQVTREAPCPVLSICPPKIQSVNPVNRRRAVTGLLAGAEA